MKIENYLSIIGVKDVATMTDSQIEEFGRYAADNFILANVFMLGTPADKKNGVDMLRAALESGKEFHKALIEYETAFRSSDDDETDSDEPKPAFAFWLT